MEVRNCRGCGRLFNYIPGQAYMCPVCMEELEKKFEQVRDYIRDNKNATMPEIARENGVKIQQIEKWIREERLYFTEDSPLGIECENCGTMIKTGRFCQKCKDAMVNNLGNVYKTAEPTLKKREDAREKARMRFLDNK